MPQEVHDELIQRQWRLCFIVLSVALTNTISLGPLLIADEATKDLPNIVTGIVFGYMFLTTGVTAFAFFQICSRTQVSLKRWLLHTAMVTALSTILNGSLLHWILPRWIFIMLAFINNITQSVALGVLLGVVLTAAPIISPDRRRAYTFLLLATTVAFTTGPLLSRLLIAIKAFVTPFVVQGVGMLLLIIACQNVMEDIRTEGQEASPASILRLLVVRPTALGAIISFFASAFCLGTILPALDVLVSHSFVPGLKRDACTNRTSIFARMQSQHFLLSLLGPPQLLVLVILYFGVDRNLKNISKVAQPVCAALTGLGVYNVGRLCTWYLWVVFFASLATRSVWVAAATIDTMYETFAALNEDSRDMVAGTVALDLLCSTLGACFGVMSASVLLDYVGNIWIARSNCNAMFGVAIVLIIIHAATCFHSWTRSRKRTQVHNSVTMESQTESAQINHAFTPSTPDLLSAHASAEASVS